MRVLFMGTPEFAVASLCTLYEAGYDICGVYTQPDKPKNRRMKLTFSPVKTYALSKGLKVYQPKNLKSGDTIEEIKSLKPDIIVVVAYGKLLPETILGLPPLGAINVHGSLLPKYRGAAPIQRAIINGERVTGVVTMFMAPEMDAGDVIDRAETDIGENETYGELYLRLKDMGAKLLLKTLRAIGNGEAAGIAQDESLATFAPPIKKEDAIINWEKPADEIINLIRGLQPKPGAVTQFAGTGYKIHRGEKTKNRTSLIPGTIVSSGNSGLEVACAGGETLLITELQAPGGKRMSAADYLRGHRIEN
ncbi:MAG: methionyl-tRNA formyltransferase [Clostridiales bacterium]|nr:methionyl-tRNA formyltransferase [Clostridiales bacterium]